MAVRSLLSKSRRRTAVTPSSSIPVKRMRQILWLPLRFKQNFDPAAGPDAHWERCTDDPLLDAEIADLAGGTTQEDARNDAYATYLYFHPYIRRFLFDEPRDTKAAATAALKVYRLVKPQLAHGLEVVLPQGQKNNPEAVHVHRFRIVRCLLYQFSVGVTLLEVELDWTNTWRGRCAKDSTGTNLSLAEALDALDFLRRTHPAYFGVGDGKADDYDKPDADRQWPDAAWRQAGGRYPLGCTVMSTEEWAKNTPLTKHGLPASAAGIPALHHLHSPGAAAADSSESAQSGPETEPRSTVLTSRRGDGFATPLCAPWSELLGKQVADACSQIEDDRMPYMAFLAVPKPHDISRGDWVRLAFADYRGDSHQLPYGEAFLANFEARHCYDRYFDRKMGWTSTRYLNTGYAFTMVGEADDEINADDKTKDKRKDEAGTVVKGFFEGAALTHFRRQYACMGLLAQFNKAALLVFSSRLSEASAERKCSGEAAYQNKIRGVLRDLLDFTHRFRFEGVSNQLQASELYRDWSNHLGLPGLHESVMAEARAAHDYVLAEEERLQTEEQIKQTLEANQLARAAVDQAQAANIQAQQSKRLTRLATYGAAAGVVLGMFGAGFPFDKPLALLLVDNPLPVCFKRASGCLIDWQRVGVVALAFSFSVYLLCRFLCRDPDSEHLKEPSQ